MKSKFVFGIACLALAATCQTAAADVIDECNPASPSAVILRACTEIIMGSSFGSDQKALAYRYRGNVRLSAGAVQPAIADFTESIRLNKENAPAFAGRGWAKFTDRDFAGAIADYNEAIRLSPNSTQLYEERGHINVAGDKPDDSIRDCTEALRLDPKNADAFNTRGFAYAKKGDFDRAQQDYSTAIRLSPFTATYYANRGYLYAAHDNAKEAIDDLRHAISLDPSLTEAMTALRRLEKPRRVASENEQRIRLGKQVAEKSCGSCHAVGAKDVSRDKFATPFRDFYRRQTNVALRAPIERAITVTHDFMPPFDLSPEQIDAIIAYIDSFVPAGPIR